jgi:hypothetical protein
VPAQNPTQKYQISQATGRCRHLPPASVLDEQVEPVQVYRHVGLVEQRHVGGPAAPDDGGHVGGGELQLVGHCDRGPDRHLAGTYGSE